MAGESAFDYDDLLGSAGGAWRSRLISLGALVLLMAVAATAVWWQFIRGGSAQTAATQTATVNLGNITTSVSTSGTVAAQSTSNLSFETPGRVTKVDVTLGQQVKQGDVIAEIDSTDTQSALASAKLSLSTAQSKLRTVLQGGTASALASADQSVQQAQTNYDKAARAMRTLQDPPDAITLASAQQAVTTAQAKLQQARDSRAKIDTDNDNAVAAAQATVDKAQNALDSAEQAQSSAEASESSSQAALYTAETAYCPDPAVAFCSAHAAPISSADRNTLVGVTDTGTPTQAALASDVLSANTDYTKALSDKQAADASVDSAETALSDAEDALDEAEQGPTAGQIAVADASIGSAQLDVDTAQDKLAKLLAGPTSDDLAAAQSDVDSAAASLSSAHAKRDEAYAGPLATDVQQQQQSVSQAQNSVDKAQKDLDNTKLVAPFDGTVAALNAHVGDLVGTSGTSASSAAAVLNTPDRVILNLTISETDYGSVKAGQTGTAVFSAIAGRTFPIVVDTIGANPTTTQGVVSYVAQAHFVAATPGGFGANVPGAAGTPGAGQAGAARRAAGTPAATPQAAETPVSPPAAGGAQGRGPGAGSGTPASTQMPMPGMNATVTIITDQRRNVLRVPNAAVQRDAQDQVLEVQQSDGTTQRVPVQVGLSDATNTQITSGVEEGTIVVLPGVTATTGATGTNGTNGAAGTGPVPGGGFFGGGGPPRGGGD